MKPLKELKDIVTPLPRGGYLVNTDAGYIQIGSPPETIKDTMLLPKNVPQIFILTNKLFSWIKGISIAELEFPIYYNFFIQKRKTYIVCNKKQLYGIKNVLKESLFGPEQLDISTDFDLTESDIFVPDIKHELEFFRNNLTLQDVAKFCIFNNNQITVNGVTISIYENGDFSISKDGKKIANIPGEIEYKPTYKIGERLPEPYKTPLFGVTCLGPSHGFDPYENTSGYIMWLNHSGIMIDPPVNSTEWLEASNVNPKLIDSIILTHCHADHDAGTFQKILEEGKVTIYTTRTVIESFIRKYSSLTNVPPEFLLRLFYFHPIKIGKPVFIHGGRFDMYYSLHSIPTIGFRMEFQDQSFVYSSDHNNDPDLHEELFRKGVIQRNRYEELKNFPWDSKVIYHESGIPPLHTPITYLDSLDDEIKKKTVVYHIAEKDFPKDTLLTLAKFGIEHTLNFETTPPPFEKAYEILGVLKHLDFLHDLPINKAQEFLTIVKEEKFKKGDLIIKKGTPGDKFYIIYSGNVSIRDEGPQSDKLYGVYDYFGEAALITDNARAADVVAETDIIVYSIEKEKFQNFIVGTEFAQTLFRLSENRDPDTWQILSSSKFFRMLTSTQKTWVESILFPMEISGSGKLINEGELLKQLYIIREGEIEITRNGDKITILKQGDFVGSVQKIYNNEPIGYTFLHNGPLSLFSIKRSDIILLAEKNPGLLMKLSEDY